MATLASVVIQDLTYTETQLGLGLTISYTNGATAGSEVVTADPQAKTISIQIESGVSTATQVRAAFNASAVATGMATCTISGTAGTAQVTCKNAAFAGGAAAVKATLALRYGYYAEAVAAGTGGNSIRFKLTSGATAGSEIVTVSTNDITVQIADGVTTWNAIKQKIAADVSAAALIVIQTLHSFNAPAIVAEFASFTALAGGAAAVAASVIVQDLTFASRATGTAKNGKTVSYTTGATAGSEVVAVDGSGNVSVQIENAVSTATQIAAARNASAAFTGAKATGTITYGSPSNGDTVVVNGTTFTKAAAGSATEFSTIGELEALIEALTGIDSSENGTVITITASTPGTAGNAITLAKTGSALVLSGATLTGGTDVYTCTVSGTGATAQKTVNAASPTGAVADGPEAYFRDQSVTALTSSFVAFNWDFNPTKNLTIRNDETSGAKTVIISRDGVNTHAILSFGESLVLNDTTWGGVYLKYGSAAPAYRLSAVGN